MRTIALRTKTVLAALTGAGVLALGIATAVPATGVAGALVHVASSGAGGHAGVVLADDKTPSVVHP